MKRIALFLALALPAFAQTPTTIANNVPIYNFNVMPGATMIISDFLGNPTPTGPGPAITANLVSGGSGYTSACVDNTLVLTNPGIPLGSQARYLIQTVSGGAVTGILQYPQDIGISLSGNVTAYTTTVSGSTTTVQLSVVNSFVAGYGVYFNLSSGPTFLNSGGPYTILTGKTSSSISVTYPSVESGSGTATGTAYLGYQNNTTYATTNGGTNGGTSYCPGTGATIETTAVALCTPTGGYTCQTNWSVTSGSVTLTAPLVSAPTAYSGASNVYTITAANNYSSGQMAKFNLATGPTVLNASTTGYAVLSVGLSSSQFEVAYVGASGSGSASGTVEADYTGTTISNGIGSVQVNVGSTPGSCTVSPSPAGSYSSPNAGPYTISSTVTATIQAQSVDDPSVTTSYLINVCANQGPVLANGQSSATVIPHYDQLYQGQIGHYVSWVTGATNLAGSWALTGFQQVSGGPATGNGVLSTYASHGGDECSDPNCRDITFSATNQGRYTITFTSTATGGTDSVIIYVTQNALPAYAFTPNATLPHECQVDPLMTGTDYEIHGGSGGTINSVNIASVPSGSTIRVWNDDTTGTNPTVYPEYYQIQQGGPQGNGVVFCGVPDVQGNLPIEDGNNATGQSGISTGAAAGFGLFSIYPGHLAQLWAQGSNGPNNVSVWNMHFRNANAQYSYTNVSPGAYCRNTLYKGKGGNYSADNEGYANTCYYSTFATNENIRGGRYVDFQGDESEGSSNGVFASDDTTSGFFGQADEAVSIRGGNFTGNGNPGQDGEHIAYLQGPWVLFEGNRGSNYNATAGGACIKDRTLGGIISYNLCDAGPHRSLDFVEVQGFGPYMDFEAFFWPATALYYSENENVPMDIIAAYKQLQMNSFSIGNLLYTGPNDLDQWDYFADNTGGMNSRNGRLWGYYNTVDEASNIISNGVGGSIYNTVLQQFSSLQNNIFWTCSNTSNPYALGINTFEQLWMDNLSNLFCGSGTGSSTSATSSIDLVSGSSLVSTPPIVGDSVSAKHARGFSKGCYYTPACPWPLTNGPLGLNAHTYDLTAGNYEVTTTQPYQPSTMAPITGSAAIGCGTPLKGLAGQLPVRFEYSVNGGLIPRTQPSVCGALEGSPPPTLVSIAITPTIATIAINGSISYSAVCTYSDGTTPTCTSGVVWATSDATVASINASGGQATGNKVGFVSVTAVEGGITSNSAGLNVISLPNTTDRGVTLKGWTTN